jgi:hypothetical protein
MSVEAMFVTFSVGKLRQFTERIEVCLGKLNEQQIWWRGHENENAIGNLVVHLAGNLGQWILAPLGGVEMERDRDAEFEARGGADARQLAAKLRAVVDQATQIIEGLRTEELTQMYTIQNYRVSGVDAVYHAVEHFAQHTAQIIFVTKMATGDDLGFYGHLRRREKSTQQP